MTDDDALTSAGSNLERAKEMLQEFDAGAQRRRAEGPLSVEQEQAFVGSGLFRAGRRV